MGTALRLLRERPRFRALWLALALSYAGSGAAATALTLYVQQREGTGIAVGALALTLSAPRLLGPLAGAIADRVDLRRAMVVCDLGQCACFAALATLPPLAPILALTALTTALQTVYGPARTAAIPALVPEEELFAANATLGIAFNLYIVVGPPLGGLVFGLLGPEWVLGLNAASFIGSALLTLRLPRLRLNEEGDGDPGGLLASVRDGVRHVAADPLVRTAILSLLFTIAFIGIDEVALVFLVRDSLGGTALAYGLVLAALGVGMLASSIGILSRLHLPPPRVYLVGLVLCGLGTLLTGLAPFIVAAALFQGVMGAGNGIVNSAGDTIVQRYVPRELVGRVFGLSIGGVAIGGGVSALLGGVLVDATSPRTTFLIGGAGALLVAALSARTLRRPPPG